MHNIVDWVSCGYKRTASHVTENQKTTNQNEDRFVCFNFYRLFRTQNCSYFPSVLLVETLKI